MRSMAPFNPYFYTAQPSYQQIPQSMQAYLPMNFPQQNVYSPYLAMQNNQLQNNMYHSYEPQGAMPMKKVKLEPTEPVKATTYIHNQDKKQQHMIMPQNQLYNNAPETSSADTTDSSAGNSPPEHITKEVDNFEIGELKMPPVLDQEDLFSDAQNTSRATYHEFFSQMEEAMKACWAKQLEFLELLKKLNKPELAMRNPVLDKVNPLIAGVMSKKAKIDENTLTVMKRTHKLLKAGPAVRTTTPKYKIPLEKNLGKRMINSSMVKEEFEAPFTSNFARKTALKAKVKENEETTDQLMAFILQGCNAGKTGSEKL